MRGGGSGGGRVSVAEVLDLSEEFLDVSIFIGGGGGEGSVVVDKLLKHGFFLLNQWPCFSGGHPTDP